MPPTSALIGPCEPNYQYVQWNCSSRCPSRNQNVCTQRANFHHALSRLGKTTMSSPEEQELLKHDMKYYPMSNKIFLMENRQIILNNNASNYITRDLSKFLGLKQRLPPLHPYKLKPNKYSDKEAASHMINICDKLHDKVRSVLVRQGRDAATWIQNYFLKSPDVFVSDRKEFIKLLEDWDQDPCEYQGNRLLWTDGEV